MASSVIASPSLWACQEQQSERTVPIFAFSSQIFLFSHFSPLFPNSPAPHLHCLWAPNLIPISLLHILFEVTVLAGGGRKQTLHPFHLRAHSWGALPLQCLWAPTLIPISLLHILFEVTVLAGGGRKQTLHPFHLRAHSWGALPLQCLWAPTLIPISLSLYFIYYLEVTVLAGGGGKLPTFLVPHMTKLSNKINGEKTKQNKTKNKPGTTSGGGTPYIWLRTKFSSHNTPIQTKHNNTSFYLKNFNTHNFSTLILHFTGNRVSQLDL